MGDDVDSVVVATPIGCHYDIVKTALTLGKNVFCEKPLTIEPELAEELIELSKKNNLALVTDYTYTFSKWLNSIATDIKLHSKISYIELSELRNTDNPKSDYWLFLTHLISMLSLFVDVKELKFYDKKCSGGINSVAFSGIINGIMNFSRCSKDKVTSVGISTSWGKVNLSNLHDGNNIGDSLEYFVDVLDGNKETYWNTELSFLVTDIIYGLMKVS